MHIKQEPTAESAVIAIQFDNNIAKIKEAVADNSIKMTRQKLAQVPLKRCVPTDYQRPTNDKQVESIVAEFNEVSANFIIVSLRDGDFHIVDGLHRSKAFKALGYTHVPCIVLTGMTYEQEAAFYRKQDKNKRLIATYDDFKAGLEANDEECIKINGIVKSNGFEIARSGAFSKISSIKTLFALVRDYGYDVLDDTLCLIANTWNGIAKASQKDSLQGVAEFVNRYGMVEFAERLKEKFSVIYYDHSEAMHNRGKGIVSSIISRREFCRILVTHYNRGLSSNAKKRLVWEESV